jgi:hypothetical protein
MKTMSRLIRVEVCDFATTDNCEGSSSFSLLAFDADGLFHCVRSFTFVSVRIRFLSFHTSC